MDHGARNQSVATDAHADISRTAQKKRMSLRDMSIFYAFFRTALSLGILLNFTHTILAQESRESIEVVTKWLKINSLAIQNIDAGRGFADLQPLKRECRYANGGDECLLR